MGLRNCTDCGKLCMENPSKLCPECYAQEENHEYTIGTYLREHGKATIEKIHEDTGVPEKIIIRMLKSGRLFTEGLIGYPCEMCREAIYEGRLCSNCARGLAKQISDSNGDREVEQRNGQQRTGLRMYTEDKKKK